jgi:uncharacterized OB-fold protein
MPDYAKPLPKPDDESQAYYDAARRHEFVLQRCTACGAWCYPARLRCPQCLGDAFLWEQASGRGKVFTFGIWHQVYHPGFAKEAPYNVTVVELEDRKSTRLNSSHNSESRMPSSA